MTDYKKLYEEEVLKNKKLKDKSKGFSNLFKKNKELNKFRNDVIETLKMDEDVEDEEMINMLDEMENDWDPIEMIELEKGKEILATQYKEHKIEIMKLKGQVEKNLERNQDLKDFRSVCDSLSLPELTDDCLMDYIKKLKEENEELEDYAMRHPCDMNCSHCGLTTTEDDLSISLDCGELTCESCEAARKTD